MMLGPQCLNIKRQGCCQPKWCLFYPPSYNICEQYKPSWKPVTCDDVCPILTHSQVRRTAMAKCQFAQNAVRNGGKAAAEYSKEATLQKNGPIRPILDLIAEKGKWSIMLVARISWHGCFTLVWASPLLYLLDGLVSSNLAAAFRRCTHHSMQFWSKNISEIIPHKTGASCHPKPYE